MDTFTRFFKVAKMDEEQRMVYGYASTPDLDTDGEIISLEAIKAALPEYLKFPTLREMHQPKAAGTIKEAEIHDGEKQGLYIGAKVVTDEAWKLVKEGVYTAFSIGGNVLKRMGNMITGLDLVEISLVDSPANKSAVIELWKAGKLSKNAEMVYSLSSLMIQAKDMSSWLNATDKKKESKQMDKIVEQIKDLIAVEAAEPEPAKGEDTMLWSQQITDIEKHVSELSALEFAGDKVGKLADAIRKGVIVAMSKTAEDLKKIADAAQAALAEVLKKPVADRTADDLKVLEENAAHLTDEQKTQLETEAKPADDKPAEEVVVVTGDQPAAPEGDQPAGEGDGEEKDAANNPAMEKLAEIDGKLDKVAAPVAPVETVDKTVSAETITKVVDSIGKLAEHVLALADKLEKIEKSVANIPAAAKSRAAFVERTTAETQPETVVKAETEQVKVMKARLEELRKLRNELGPVEFGKRGHSKEAMDLMSKLGM